MLGLRRLLPLLLLPVLVFALPAEAKKKKHHHHHGHKHHTPKPKPPATPQFAIYDVEFAGSGSYAVDSSDSAGNSSKDGAGFTWDVKYNQLFVQRKAHAPVGAPANAKTSTGSGNWQLASVTSDHSDDCTKAGTLRLGPSGGVEGIVQDSGKLPLKLDAGEPDFTTLGGDDGGTACSTTDFWHDFVQSFSHIGNGNGSDGQDVNPITAFVTLSKDDFKQGKIVENVSNTTLQAPSLTVNPDCGSDASNGVSCSQSFKWTGQVTLTKRKTS